MYTQFGPILFFQYYFQKGAGYPSAQRLRPTPHNTDNMFFSIYVFSCFLVGPYSKRWFSNKNSEWYPFIPFWIDPGDEGFWSHRHQQHQVARTKQAPFWSQNPHRPIVNRDSSLLGWWSGRVKGSRQVRYVILLTHDGSVCMPYMVTFTINIPQFC